MTTKGAPDFDSPIDRRDTSSVKWEKYRGRDVIPMWVADMDFATAPAVIEELERRIRHGVYGYPVPPAQLSPTIAATLERDYGWRIDPQWVVLLPGLVVGLNVVCRAFAAEGDEILSATPIYPPFLSAPEHANRVCVRVPLIEDGGTWRWDFERLEHAVTPKTRLLLLCSPHNPTGRVWSRGELSLLAEFCLRRRLIMVSDEIHCGLVLDPGLRHWPVAGLDPSIGEQTVTLMSASKTFNFPALGCAFAIASNPELRSMLRRTMAGIVHHVGALGMFATLAAYRDGRAWQLALLDYLRANRDLVESMLGAAPGLRVFHAEATYLAWIDVRAISDPVRRFEEAGVGLYDGSLFGTPGYVRLNFACPRALLEQALARIAAAARRWSEGG